MYKNIEFIRKEYSDALPKWGLVDDACEGELAVKAKTTDYVPKPNPEDCSRENELRYKQYLARAVFYGATKRTLQGLVGTAFTKTPIINLGPNIEYMRTDADGSGVGLAQMARSTVSEVLKKGRQFLFVDYPVTNGDTKRKDLNHTRATISAVDARKVINWRVKKVGSQCKYTLVVIKEEYDSETDVFKSNRSERYRVLQMVDGTYQVTIVNVDGDKYIEDGVYTPTKADGSTWDEIPGMFVGAINNDDTIDDAPLYELAVVNMAHFRNSADYEDSVFFSGQPQAWISGLDEEWRDHLEKSGIYVGSRTPILLPENGAFGFAQAQPNTLAKEAMDQKEDQMVALGARLIKSGTVAKTATEAQGEIDVSTSVLALAVSNVCDVYSRMLAWVSGYMNDTAKSDIAIDTDFIVARLDAQMLTALVAGWQSKLIPTTDAWAKLKKHGIIDPTKDDDAIKDELEGQTDGLALDD